MGETWVQLLAQEDPTCCGATKAVCHLSSCYRTWELQLPSSCTTATEPAHLRACVLQKQKPPQWEVCAKQWDSSPRLPQLEKSPCNNEDTAQPKNKTKKKEKKLLILLRFSKWVYNIFIILKSYSVCLFEFIVLEQEWMEIEATKTDKI